jgi:F-type H+-transporting ATPase subunit alpha
VTRFEHGLLDEVRAKGQDILAAIRDEQALSEETDTKLTAFLDGYAKTFA